MSTQSKKLFAFLGLLASLVILYYVLFYKPKPTAEVQARMESAGVPQEAAEEFPLQQGSRGENVRAWQTFLYGVLYPQGVKRLTKAKYCDGIFGPITARDTERMLGEGIQQVDLATFLDAMELLNMAGSKPDTLFDKVRKGRTAAAKAESTTAGQAAAGLPTQLVAAFMPPRVPFN